MAIFIKEISSISLQKSEYLVYHENFYPEILIIERGKGNIGINGENHKIRAPLALFIGANRKYDLFARSDIQARSIIFQTDIDIEKAIDVLKVDKDKIQSLLAQDEERVQAVLETIIDEYSNALRLAEEGYSNDTIVFRVKEYLKDNYKDKIDLKTLAGTFGYSYDRFRHIFKETTGTTLNKYLLDYRFEESKKLLIESDFYVKQIAKVTGFNSSVYFNNFFKSRYRITPHCYRRALRRHEGESSILITPLDENCGKN